MKEDNKLFLYSKLKKEYKIEPYIKNCKNLDERKLICKMRIGDHFLEIERGRYKNIERKKRFCTFCHDKLDDELHFFLHCKTNNLLRQDFINNCRKYCKNFDQLGDWDKVISVLHIEKIVQLAGPFIKKSWSLRKEDTVTA